MTGFFPIPRSFRSDDIELSQGETETSARDWRIFDDEDIRVLWRPDGSEDAFVELDASAYTVTPAAPETKWPAFPIVVLNEGFDEDVTLRIRGARLYERLASVSQGGAIKGAALEREFGRIVVTLQEMRRDLNALEGLSVDVDAAGDAREGAELALASVRAIYLGELASDPTTRLDGSALQGGEWYVRPDGTQRVYTSGSETWTNAPQGPEGGTGDMPAGRVKGRAIGAGIGPPADLDQVAIAAILELNSGAYAEVGSGADQVPTNAMLPPPTPPVGLFVKADRREVAWTKTAAGTAETQTSLTVEVNGAIVEVASGTSISMPTLTAGTDYAIWLSPAGALEADTSFSAAPTANGRLVGGFHYAPGGNAPAFNSGGNTTPQINEHSFWDLKFRPACPDPRGMTLVAQKFWCDIYLLGVNHNINGTSKFNSRIADDGDPPKIPDMFGGNGSSTYSNANWWTLTEVLASHGKQPLSYQEFAAAAYGVVEATSGGTDPVDTILRQNWTSIWGLILAAGNMYIWGADFGGGAAGASWSANTGGRGSTYQMENVALFGGYWANAADAGSRSSSWDKSPSDSNSAVGARGRSDHLNHE